MKRNLTLCLLSGITFALAFPPLKLGFLAYGTLIPFFLLLENKSIKESFRWGYAASFIANVGTIYWIAWVTFPGAIGAILVLPLFTALFAIFFTFLRKEIAPYHFIALPFIWTGMEYLRSLGETGFPWLSLGYTQTYYLALIQHASITSVYGVSFWIVIINVLIFVLWKHWCILKLRYTTFAIVILLWLGPFVHGSFVLASSHKSTEKINIVLIQGNIDPFSKWDSANRRNHYELYKRLTGQAVLNHKPDLVIWPETATTFFLQHDFEYLSDLRYFLDSLQVPLLTGSQDWEYLRDNRYRFYNAAYLVQPSVLTLQRYAKLHLVPFGERVPFEDFLPQFKRIFDYFEMGQGDFSPGKEYTIFSFRRNDTWNDNNEKTQQRVLAVTSPEQIRFATPICYESIFPELIREFVKRNVHFLAIITNDAWFGKTSGPFQHAQIAIFRAVENRIAIARCANTGVSMFIDPYGRSSKHTKIFETAIALNEIPLRNQKTFYSENGNIFTISISLIGVLFIFSGLIIQLFHRKLPGSFTVFS